MEHSGLSAGLRARVSLEKHGFNPKHSLGQNFILEDRLIIQLLDAFKKAGISRVGLATDKEAGS